MEKNLLRLLTNSWTKVPQNAISAAKLRAQVAGRGPLYPFRLQQVVLTLGPHRDLRVAHPSSGVTVRNGAVHLVAPVRRPLPYSEGPWHGSEAKEEALEECLGERKHSQHQR